MKNKSLIISVITLFAFIVNVNAQDNDNLLKILRSELKTQFEELKNKEIPPYLMSYRVIDRTTSTINSTFGCLERNVKNRNVSIIPQIRIGDINFDNFKMFFNGNNKNTMGYLPIDDNGSSDAVRQAIWNETLSRYNFAVGIYKDSKTKTTTTVDSEDKAPCYSTSIVEKHYEAPISADSTSLDAKVWELRLNEISAIFKNNGNINYASASINYLVERRYFIDTEGREIVQNLPYTNLLVSAQMKAEDGMDLLLTKSYFAYDPKDLPLQDSVMTEAKEILAKLIELRDAPVAEPYSGPAILSGAASGVFFHEIFGHRIEGQRMKSDSDGQTFKKMVGKYVLPKELSVSDDPTRNSYNGIDLNGYYKFDDQGIRAERVHVVKNGILNDFLMTRTPIDGFARSNGHARGEQGFDPISRQSNLIIESSNNKTDTELRRLLILEAEKQNKEYGYFFKEVTGGLTFTGKQGVNSFNVTPLEVYKIYVDGRQDQLVRGADLIGTPLSMFSNIKHTGGRSQVFTGMCGAESGSIPVTAISPSILVTKVEVQLKAKSQVLPPILNCPISK